MTDILDYTIINPIPDKNYPYVKNGILYIPNVGNYRYFLEAIKDNDFGTHNYYILLSRTKFNYNCRTCSKDGYGRLRLKLKGEIKEYVYDKCATDGNCEFEYIESGEDYDVFNIR